MLLKVKNDYWFNTEAKTFEKEVLDLVDGHKIFEEIAGKDVVTCCKEWKEDGDEEHPWDIIEKVLDRIKDKTFVFRFDGSYCLALFELEVK